MPTYEIEQYEVHAQSYLVDADDEAQAIKRLFAGDGEPLDDSLEFIETASDLGLPAESCPDLTAGLRALGIRIGEVIPTIRAIRQVR